MKALGGLLVLLATVTTGALAQEPGSTLPSDLREEAQVRRIQWPVTFEPLVPGGCDELRLGDVLVREDDIEAPVEGVEPPVGGMRGRRMPAIHAIVIDNSASMDARLGAAKKAARAYLERLPAGEPAMIASFSDNLILKTSLTPDRETLLRSLKKIESRANTALIDAIYYTANYLSGRPERKILVLITDGCDSASLTAHTLDDVVQLASRVPDLTVFPIGINLPARCDGLSFGPGYIGGPILPLQKLATNSGGYLYRTKEAAALELVFDEILERVEREGFVSYRPVPHGQGKKDRPGETRNRRVKIVSARPKECRVESAGPLTRAEPPPGAAAETPLQSDDATTVRYTDWWSEKGGASPALGRLELLPNAMIGHGADLDRERSWLYSATGLYIAERYISEADRKVRIERRDFRIDVPPFEWLQRSMTDPESMLLYLMQGDDAPFLKIEDPRGRREQVRRVYGDKWVHGQTMLEIREALGRGLFTYPGYRELAYRKTREAYRAEMQRVLQHSPTVQALEPDEREKLKRLVDEQRPDPTPGQLQQYLAEWLGDISAYDLVVGFEGWASNAVLDSDVPDQTAAFLLNLIDTKWTRLREWFPPPTQVRIITPLVPSYDANRDLVGFWRILLPEVAYSGPPRDMVPEYPLGLTFLRRLTEVTGGRDAWPEGVRMQEMSYRWDKRNNRRRIVRGARKRELIDRDIYWKKIPMVHVEIGPDGEDPLPCTVLWDPEPSRVDAIPAAICVDFDDAMTKPLDGWAEELRDSILDMAPECALKPPKG